LRKRRQAIQVLGFHLSLVFLLSFLKAMTRLKTLNLAKQTLVNSWIVRKLMESNLMVPHED
jgi:hypothetical protein